MGFGTATSRRRRRRVKPFLWAGFSIRISCSKSRASIPWRFGGEAGSFIFLRVALFYSRSSCGYPFSVALRLRLGFSVGAPASPARGPSAEWSRIGFPLTQHLPLHPGFAGTRAVLG